MNQQEAEASCLAGSQHRLGPRGPGSELLLKVPPAHTVWSTWPQGQGQVPGLTPHLLQVSAPGTVTELLGLSVGWSWMPHSVAPPPGASGFQGPQKPTLVQVSVDVSFPSCFLNLLSVLRAFLVSLARSENGEVSQHFGAYRQVRHPFSYLHRI